MRTQLHHLVRQRVNIYNVYFQYTIVKSSGHGDREILFSMLPKQRIDAVWFLLLDEISKKINIQLTLIPYLVILPYVQM